MTPKLNIKRKLYYGCLALTMSIWWLPSACNFISQILTRKCSGQQISTRWGEEKLNLWTWKWRKSQTRGAQNLTDKRNSVMKLWQRTPTCRSPVIVNEYGSISNCAHKGRSNANHRNYQAHWGQCWSLTRHNKPYTCEWNVWFKSTDKYRGYTCS